MHTTIENNWYTWLAPIVSPVTVIFPYADGPEPASPYIVVDLYSYQPLGMPQIESGVTAATSEAIEVIQNWRGQIQIKCVGMEKDYTTGNHPADILNLISFSLQDPTALDVLKTLGLTVFRHTPVKRIPDLRDTQYVTAYAMDIHFMTASRTTPSVYDISSVDITGTLVGSESSPISVSIPVTTP